ncbi:MAG: hypothetical protein AAF787_15835 [Chloroflexota bacterium]
MAHAERAVERIYEDESLTDEMMDDEAKVLLRWGENAVFELDSDEPDDETFDNRFKQMRKLMKRVNKFIGQRSSISDEEAQEMVAKFQSTAVDMGHDISAERLAQFMTAQKTMTNTEATQAMLALLQPPADEAEDSTDETEPAPPPLADTPGKSTEEKRNLLKSLIDFVSDDDNENDRNDSELWDKRV